MKPFPYQEAAIKAFLDDYEQSPQGSGLLYLATGTGKTVIAAHIAKELNKPLLFFVHRDELAKQAIAKIKAVWPAADIGLVKSKTNELGRMVTVASVQSLSQARAEQLLAANNYGLLIQDEAHHAAAPTWERAIKTFPCYRLGLSATPVRSDNVRLDHIFERVLYKYTIMDAIKDGYLADITGIKIDLTVSIDDVTFKAGDISSQEAGKLLAQRSVLEVMHSKWVEYAADRKTVAFTCDVAHAQAMADYFSLRGVSAEWVAGCMSPDDRAAVLRRFSTGKTQFLANCMILTEGWDEPAVDCVLMARPTSSESLYIQSVGRGLRRFPGKQNCLVLDFVASTTKHKIMQLADLTGIPYQQRSKQESGADKKDPVVKSIREIIADANVIDFYRKEAQQFDWIHHDDLLALQMGFNNYLIVRPAAIGYETVNAYLKGWKYTETVLYRASVQDLCISIAEDSAKTLSTGANLQYQAKGYDNGFISPKQAQIIVTNGHSVPASSKDASKLISRIFFARFIAESTTDAEPEQKKQILKALLAGNVTCKLSQADINRLRKVEAEKIIKFYASGVKYNYARRYR